MTVIAGAYNAVWNGLEVGNTESGFRLRHSYEGRRIRFDAVGTGPVDVIYTGLSMFVDFVASEFYAEALEDMRWPFNVILGSANPTGFSMWQAAKPLVLTSCLTGTNPQTITFYKTILAPDYEVETNYSGTVERLQPLRMMVFPVKYDANGYLDPEQPASCVEQVFYEETLWP